MKKLIDIPARVAKAQQTIREKAENGQIPFFADSPKKIDAEKEARIMSGVNYGQ